MLKRIPNNVDYWFDFADLNEKEEIKFLSQYINKLRNQLKELRQEQRPICSKASTKRWRYNKKRLFDPVKDWRLFIPAKERQRYNELEKQSFNLKRQICDARNQYRIIRERCRRRRAKIAIKKPRQDGGVRSSL